MEAFWFILCKHNKVFGCDENDEKIVEMKLVTRNTEVVKNLLSNVANMNSLEAEACIIIAIWYQSDFPLKVKLVSARLLYLYEA